MNNNQMAWNIYEALKSAGAEIGNMSVPIIERELDKAAPQQPAADAGAGDGQPIARLASLGALLGECPKCTVYLDQDGFCPRCREYPEPRP